jgi:FixJ family two-component response regulator
MYRIKILLTIIFGGINFEEMIYIIEDDLSVRRAYEFFPDSEGMEYKSSGTVRSFLTGYMPTMRDLHVLDINLPNLSGLDLLKIFTRERKKIPVIVVTARDDAECRECCTEYGVKAYLRKPVDGEELIEIINSS